MAKATALPLNLPPRLLMRAQAAAYVSLSPNTFDIMVWEGVMPQPRHLTGNRTAWDIRELDRAIDALPHSGAKSNSTWD